MSDRDAARLERADAGGPLAPATERRLDREIARACRDILAVRRALARAADRPQRHQVGSLRSAHSGRRGLDENLRARIRRLRAAGLSLGAIARELDVRRETVAKTLRGGRPLPRCPGCGARLTRLPCAACGISPAGSERKSAA